MVQYLHFRILKFQFLDCDLVIRFGQPFWYRGGSLFLRMGRFTYCYHMNVVLNEGESTSICQLWLTGAKRREWMGCWGLLGWLLLVMKWIIPEKFPAFSTSKLRVECHGIFWIVPFHSCRKPLYLGMKFTRWGCLVPWFITTINIYPLVNIQKAFENGPLKWWICPLNMVIFPSVFCMFTRG